MLEKSISLHSAATPDFMDILLRNPEDGKSFAWRCATCFRVFVFDDRVEKPAARESCDETPTAKLSYEVVGCKDFNANGTWRVDPNYGNVWMPPPRGR